jgi:DNA-binding HxlR family transcriptional regulator
MAVSAAIGRSDGERGGAAQGHEACCGLYHRSVEMIGKRWTGAIVLVLMDGPLRFSEIRHRIPDLSDRLLSERLKELEGEGIVVRHVMADGPVRVEYELSPKGRALEPAVTALKSWAQAWLEADAPSSG